MLFPAHLTQELLMVMVRWVLWLIGQHLRQGLLIHHLLLMESLIGIQFHALTGRPQLTQLSTTD